MSILRFLAILLAYLLLTGTSQRPSGCTTNKDRVDLLAAKYPWSTLMSSQNDNNVVYVIPFADPERKIIRKISKVSYIQKTYKEIFGDDETVFKYVGKVASF